MAALGHLLNRAASRCSACVLVSRQDQTHGGWFVYARLFRRSTGKWMQTDASATHRACLVRCSIGLVFSSPDSPSVDLSFLFSLSARRGLAACVCTPPPPTIRPVASGVLRRFFVFPCWCTLFCPGSQQHRYLWCFLCVLFCPVLVYPFLSRWPTAPSPPEEPTRPKVRQAKPKRCGSLCWDASRGCTAGWVGGWV